MQVKVKVELCKPKPEQSGSEIVWNGERGCHCIPPQPDTIQGFSDPRIRLHQETIVMHVSVVMIKE